MAHTEHSPTAAKTLDADLPRALGAAITAIALASLLIGALALLTASPSSPASQGAAAPVTDGWMSYLGGSAPVADVVDGWSSYLTPPAATVIDGWQSYLGATAAPDVIDGWMSRFGRTGD